MLCTLSSCFTGRRGVTAKVAGKQKRGVCHTPGHQAVVWLSFLGHLIYGKEHIVTILYVAIDSELAALRPLPSAPTWSFPPRPWTSHIRWITPDPLVPGRVFAAAEAGALIRSLDGGQTWEDRKPSGPFDTHTLVMHRRAPNRLYSAAGDGFLHPGNGFVQSDDGGDTWYRPDAGLAYHYLWSVAADPADPDMLVISAAPGPQEAHNPMSAESAIYRRSGGGQWQQVREGLPSARGLLASVLAANEPEPGASYP